MNARFTFMLLLLATFLAGCTPSAQPPAPTPTASFLEAPELAATFSGYTACFILYDQDTGQTMRYNPSRCAEGLLPASTFKILNALIGLETGVIPDENYLIPWNGTQYPVTSWNQDHTMQTAIQNSVVWYFQELVRRVGREQIQHYIDLVGYGNQNISGNFESFWLDGALRISADQQIAFLRRFYAGDLPFSQRSMQIVRKILVLEKTSSYQLTGKTGNTQVNGVNIGWFVGYLEIQGNVYFFATNIEDTSQDPLGSKAREITQQILQGKGILPTS